ncbi:uncharacterized protein STEHIDRAFT_114979 [Stereum hirsutum FP-91666 SS1]|uniref:uncharacterized protein n=1 Tax=Stereum hirsutum (strain FP-91666) TaxID=721885 RepID=UPI0004449E8B|nr:uncharacterized protein STEHIDRAFT_114979 [Stereum hirsutum FP-91666 SS1]EIM81562.1 hypothetical protein STEHIDRAFT_114979 [Stereum hirsutum FP-91666 SS1]
MSLIKDTDEKLQVTFKDIYDDNEDSKFFKGDLRFVPSGDRELSSWLTIVTHLDEHQYHGTIYTDVVYIADPSMRLTIRIKAMVTGLNFGSCSAEYTGGEQETLHLGHGGSVDETSYAIQHQRLNDIRKACSSLARGSSTSPHKYPALSSSWGKMILVLSRRANKSRKPVRVEILTGDTLVEADTDAIEIGDIVDVPVWMDVWNGPADLNVDPWTLTSFDRLVIVEKKTKTGGGKELIGT